MNKRNPVTRVTRVAGHANRKRPVPEKVRPQFCGQLGSHSRANWCPVTQYSEDASVFGATAGSVLTIADRAEAIVRSDGS